MTISWVSFIAVFGHANKSSNCDFYIDNRLHNCTFLFFPLFDYTEAVHFSHEFGGNDVKEDKNLELEFWKQVWEGEIRLLCQA